MTAVDLARWQFGFVTVNHFFFIPVTIGLAFLTALPKPPAPEKQPKYLQLTRSPAPLSAWLATERSAG